MKKLFIIIFFLGVSNVVFGQDTIAKIEIFKKELQQEKVDTTRVSKNIAIAKLYFGKNADSALYYFNKGLELATKINSKHHIAKVYNGLGKYYEFESDYANAIKNYTDASIYFNKEANSNCEAKAYIAIANSYSNLFAEEKSIEFYFKSLAIYVKNKNEIGIANNYNGIGNLYYSEENYDFAKKYFEDALLIYEKYSDENGMSTAYTNIGNVVSDKGEYFEGLKYYEKSIAIEELINDQYGIAVNYNNIGDSYIKLKKYTTAQDYFVRSLKIAQKLDDIGLKAIIYLNMADIQFKLKNFNKTIDYSQKSLSFSKKIGQLDYEAYNLLNLARAYEQIGNNKYALNYSKEYIKLSDSISKMDKSKKVQLFNTLNNLNQSINTIDDLSSKNELAMIKYENGKKFMKFLIIAMLLFGLFVIILIIQQTDKKKAYNLLEYRNHQIRKMHDEIEEQRDNLEKINNTKDKFFSIIAHDLKNPFNSIKGFTELIIENNHDYDEEKKLKFLRIIKESTIKASNLLDNILIWASSQSGNLSFDLKKIELMKEVSNVISLVEIQAINKDIKIVNKVENELYVLADENMLGTILRNLISNAIKFTAPNGKIQISSNLKGDFIEVTVKDNGVGISKSDLEKLFKIDEKYSNIGTANEQGTGLGLVLCKDFIEKHGGTIWAQSNIDEGSEFKFTIPTWLNNSAKTPKSKIQKVLLNI